MQKTLGLLLVAILAIYIPGLALDWFYVLPWLDIPMHVAGGFWVGLLFYYLFAVRSRLLLSLKFIPFFVLGLGFVALVGVLWEFYEFLADIFVLKAYPPLLAPGHIHADTLADLLNDFIGGAVGLLIARTAFKTKHAAPLRP